VRVDIDYDQEKVLKGAYFDSARDRQYCPSQPTASVRAVRSR